MTDHLVQRLSDRDQSYIELAHPTVSTGRLPRHVVESSHPEAMIAFDRDIVLVLSTEEAQAVWFCYGKLAWDLATGLQRLGRDTISAYWNGFAAQCLEDQERWVLDDAWWRRHGCQHPSSRSSR